MTLGNALRRVDPNPTDAATAAATALSRCDGHPVQTDDIAAGVSATLAAGAPTRRIGVGLTAIGPGRARLAVLAGGSRSSYLPTDAPVIHIWLRPTAI